MDDAWYKKWFNRKEYLELYSHRNKQDAAKIAGLITKTLDLPKGSKVLDLACGNGRHSVYFAKKGFDVLGIDLSQYLINEARKNLKTDYLEWANRLRFEIGDMRRIGHRNEFDLVVNLFSSFGYFEPDSENLKVLNSISLSLKKNGYFFFDFLNESYLRKHLVDYDITKRNRNIVIQVRYIRDDFVNKNIFMVRNKRNDDYPEINSFHERIRLFSLTEFKKMFRSAGLKIIKTYGDYSGSAFNKKNSPRLIIMAKKT
jgi:SAM-dependent methyltransferase